jgi:hypothetical protein
MNTSSTDEINIGLLVCNILPPSSGLMMEAICSSKTMVSTYKSTWDYNPEASTTSQL